MNKIKFYLGLIVIGFLFSSCKSYWVAPAFTSVDKLVSVRPGMNVNEVNKTLGIEPYNVYNMQEDGNSIVLYNYRTKSRKVIVSQDPKLRENYIRGEESSQTEGTTWYNPEWQVAYVIFNNGKVKSILTDQGRADGEYLLLVQNNIQSISKENVTNYKLTILDSLQHPQNIIVPLSDNLRKVDKGNTTIQNIEKKGGKGKKALLISGGILVSILLISLIL